MFLENKYTKIYNDIRRSLDYDNNIYKKGGNREGFRY